ncbi:hypothetical protein PIIN_07499 [Serendipita indica DSM 11827]|uniref:Uncharacterized protein n=1 Tax=Serendipita indica (strain DSM 11827) TaxID=1109443 RepID=G4TQF3_SERID|nr:hypothetical protein PIIN_07499 [Serendipita indica DSM 11827]
MSGNQHPCDLSSYGHSSRHLEIELVTADAYEDVLSRAFASFARALATSLGAIKLDITYVSWWRPSLGSGGRNIEYWWPSYMEPTEDKIPCNVMTPEVTMDPPRLPDMYHVKNMTIKNNYSVYLTFLPPGPPH